MQIQDWNKYVTPKKNCLVWDRAVSTDGYPRALIKGNANAKVHRELFKYLHGYLPEVVRHLCDNPLCLNPEHLVPGTQIDNIKDRVTRHRTFFSVEEGEAEKVHHLRDQGMKYKQIAETLSMKTRRVEYILTRWRKESY